MIIRAFITHKQAELFADCQDRFGVNKDTKSIAVSDGMGATWQQKIWAQILVETFIDSKDWIPTIESIKPLCQLWRDRVVEFIEKLKEVNAPVNIIYRNERNLVAGRSAGATIIGLRFNGNKWHGSVLGDSCLIEWNGIEAKFHTSQEVDSFDSYPDYFDSDESKEGKGTPKSISGNLDAGSYLLLVSDPFSDFLLEHNKQGDIADYIQQLLDISSHDDFEGLVEDWRKVGMHNDDTTLVIVEDDGSDNFSTKEIDDINVFIDKEKENQENNHKAKIESEEKDEAKFEIEKESVIVEDVPIEKAVQENEEYMFPSNEQNVPPKYIESDVFIEEFINEYKNELEKKHCKLMGQLKYGWTQKAAKKTLCKLLAKYSIINK